MCEMKHEKVSSSCLLLCSGQDMHARTHSLSGHLSSQFSGVERFDWSSADHDS